MYYEMSQGTIPENNCICPLCDTSAHEVSDQRMSMFMVICPTCGKFRFDARSKDLFLEPLRKAHNNSRYKISHNIRSISERARGKRVDSFFPVYRHHDFEVMLDRPDPSVKEKLDSLLRYLASLSEYPGHAANFDYEHDYSVLGAKKPQEACFYVQALQEQRLLAFKNYTGINTVLQFTLSTDGWTELDRITQSGAESSNAFIAMWFNPSRSAFDDATQQAITGAGYIPVRIDQVEHLNRIDDEIIARLTEVRGVGRWTVEMLLIFQLGRENVLPVDDFGVRSGFRVAYKKRELPTPKELLKFGERWHPHATTAAWYLWRTADAAKKK